MADPAEIAARMSNIQADGLQFSEGPAPIQGIPLLTPLYRLTGLSTPAERFLATSAIATAVLWTVQPNFAFSNGQPRPWAVANPSSEATHVPWFAVPLVAGFAASFFA